jgi:hypothetical protein
MNIRLSEGQIRFRVTTQEFEKLSRGDYVQLETIPLTFVVTIAKKPLDQAMVIDLSCGAVQLVISPEEMKAFQARLPSKHGIEKTLSLGMGKSIDVAFEVDVRPEK